MAKHCVAALKKAAHAAKRWCRRSPTTIAEAVAQDYYAGDKESEVPALRKLIGSSLLASQKISLDALHCKPLTLSIVSNGGSKYLVGLKDNQKKLKKQITRAMTNQAALFTTAKEEKSHGRSERRDYEFYDVLELEKDERWKTSRIKTAIKVSCDRVEIKSRKTDIIRLYP